MNFLLLLFLLTNTGHTQDEILKRLDAIENQINSQTDSRLSISKKDRAFLKETSKNLEPSIPSRKKSSQIQEKDIKTFVEDLQEKRKEKNLPQSEVGTLFLNTVDIGMLYHSPVKVGNSTFLFSNGISPTDTPRRKKNTSRLLNGKAPICIDSSTNEEIACDFHHLNQQDDDLIIQLSKEFHKKYHGGLHQNLKAPSAIDRAKFNRQKDRANRKKGLRMLKKMIIKNQELTSDESLQALGSLPDSDDELI